MTSLTRAFEDNPPAISEQAFHQLADLYPQDVANVIYELASAGDIASCTAALNSGIAQEVSTPAVAFAMLPLQDKHPEAEAIVTGWIQQSGSSGRLGEALLQTRDPEQAARLIRRGAKLDVENSNHQNALLFAISQQNADMVRAILCACNEVSLEPRATNTHNIFDLLLRRSMSEMVLTLIFDAFPPIDAMKPAFRTFAGSALNSLAGEHGGWLTADEKAAPLTDKTREIARRLMEFADLKSGSTWSAVLGCFGVFASEDFLLNQPQQMAVFANLLANGVDVNHVFDDMITTGFDAAGVRKLVKGSFLHFAAAQNNPELLTANLQAGADVTLAAGGRTLAQFLAKSERARDALDAWESKREAGLHAKRQAIASILYQHGETPAVTRVPETKPVEAAQADQVADPATEHEVASAVAGAAAEVAVEAAVEVVAKAPAQAAPEPVAEPAAQATPAATSPTAHEPGAPAKAQEAVSPAANDSVAFEEPAAAASGQSGAPAPAPVAAPAGGKKGFGFKKV